MKFVNRHRVTDMHMYICICAGTRIWIYPKMYVKKYPFADEVLYVLTCVLKLVKVILTQVKIELS